MATNMSSLCIRVHGGSFGEAFHVGAASILAGVSWRTQYGKEAMREQAAAFLHETTGKPEVTAKKLEVAGEATKLVAKCFKEGASAARQKLEERWLAVTPNERQRLHEFAARWLGACRQGKVLLWNRASNDYEETRNTSPKLLDQVSRILTSTGLWPVFFGHPMGVRSPSNLTGLWREPEFENGKRTYILQLYFVFHLREEHGVVAQVGSRSGGMDGHALLGLPTIYFEDAPPGEKAKRMERWTRGIVPKFHRVLLNDRDDVNLGVLSKSDHTDLSITLAEAMK